MRNLLVAAALGITAFAMDGASANARYLHVADAVSAAAIYGQHMSGGEQTAARCRRMSGKVLACWTTITGVDYAGTAWDLHLPVTAAAHGPVTRVASVLWDERVDIGPTRRHFYTPN